MTTSLPAQLLVLAKSPVPGSVKTRLCPPYSPYEAAALAEAALRDTLAAVAATSLQRHVAALDGAAGDWLPPGIDVIGQRGDGLDERIANAIDDAWASCDLPVVLIGMDTPQVTPGQLDEAARQLLRPESDAVLGPSQDGGFWLIGLRRPDPRLIRGVPMSTSQTGAAQCARLLGAGLRVHRLATLRDVDTAEDAEAVAAAAPDGRFAAAVARLSPRPLCDAGTA